MWCLYGKTIHGLKNPDIVPWTGKGTTIVEVTIKVDKSRHVIRRTVSPNLLSIDGKEAGQEYVSKLIGIPFEIIPYTIVLGQRMPLFFDLTAGEKLKLFSETLNLDRWENRSAHASQMVVQLENEIRSSESEVSALLRDLDRIAEDTNDLKIRSKEWEDDRDSRLQDREKSKKELQKSVDTISKTIDTADLALDSDLTELKAINPELSRLEKELSKVTLEFYKLERSKDANNAKVAALSKQLDALHKDKCPTCGQAMKSAKQLKELENSITSEIKFFDTFKIDKEIVELTKRQKELEKVIGIQKEARDKFQDDSEQARDTLNRLAPRKADWLAQIKAIDQASTELLDTDNPYTGQLQDLRRKKDQTKVLVEKTEGNITIKREYCERVRYWIKGFKDIKLYTIEEILQELEITTNSMCEEFGLVGWSVKYDIERETKSGTTSRGLNISVLSPDNKKAVKWEVWSGGEAQRLRIIGTAALNSVLLNHLGVTTNLEIFDEPTESLSKEGISDLVELLAQRAKSTGKNIWMIDHHTVESYNFVETVMVTKDRSGSVLEVV